MAGRRGGRAAAAGRWASLALIVAGVVLRLVEYGSGRALWLDETFLWINLESLPARALAGPLDLGQGAPIPFLLAEKGVVETLGDAEWALRLISLLAGIATLVVAQRLAARVLSAERAWIAVAPLALSIPLIFYSSVLKQYSLDVLVATLLLWALVWAAGTRMTARRAVLLAGIGATAVWCSDPAVFVLTGGGVALLVDAAASRSGDRLRLLVAAMAAWLVSFGVLYLVHVRDLATVRGLATADTGDGSARAVWRIFRAMPDGLAFPIGGSLLVPLLTQALVLLGLLALWRRGRRVEAGILGLPIAALLLAAVLGQYPVGGRFGIFIAPALAVAFGAGVLAVWDAARGRGRAIAAIAAAAGIACAVPYVARLSDTSPVNQELDSVTTAIEARREPGDQIYLYYATQYAYRYYGAGTPIAFAELPTRGPGVGPPRDFWGVSEPVLASGPGRVVGRYDDSFERLVRDVDRMRGADRFWIVFSHYGPDEATEMVRRARTFARPLEIVRADGAFAVLMERRR